jgi:hypothetical protein
MIKFGKKYFKTSLKEMKVKLENPSLKFKFKMKRFHSIFNQKLKA